MANHAKIDLAKYRTDELASKVAEILSVPASIRTVMKTTLFAILLLIVANSLLYAAGNRALFPWLVSSLYALVIATVLGFILGLIRVARLLALRSEGLLQLTLKTSNEVAIDYQSVRSGERQMPAATEIVEHVYDGVVLPAMESAVTNSFGFVGTPLLWVYRRTIGGFIRFVIKRMKTDSLTDEDRRTVELEADKLFRDVADNASNIESVLGNALSFTQHASRMLRRVFLWPVQLVFGLVACAAVVPLVLCWYWTH